MSQFVFVLTKSNFTNPTKIANIGFAASTYTACSKASIPFVMRNIITTFYSQCNVETFCLQKVLYPFSRSSLDSTQIYASLFSLRNVSINQKIDQL